MSNKVEITGISTSNLPKLSGKEQAELMERLKKGDKEAREQFAICNMRLVLSVVQRFRGRKENTDDIFQVGCVGLMKAIDNFDINLNVKFSTYAVPMIAGEVKRYLRDNGMIKVSRGVKALSIQITKYIDEYYNIYEHSPSIEEIADKFAISVVGTIGELAIEESGEFCLTNYLYGVREELGVTPSYVLALYQFCKEATSYVSIPSIDDEIPEY